MCRLGLNSDRFKAGGERWFALFLWSREAKSCIGCSKFDQEICVKHQTMSKFGIKATHVVVALFLPTLCVAQGSVSDPAAAVPPVVYQSVFVESPKGVETQSIDWKKANADVAQFPRGHVDILKWEEAQIKGKAQAAPQSPQPPKSPTPPAAGPLPAAVHKH
jgi:hypothetical protein